MVLEDLFFVKLSNFQERNHLLERIKFQIKASTNMMTFISTCINNLYQHILKISPCTLFENMQFL